MAIHKDSIVDVDLTSGTIHRSFLNHSIGMNDSDGDFFGVRVFKNGVPVDLTNVSVQGHFNPPVGAPIFLNAGNYISGNVATVRLPQACYNYEGPFSLAIKLVTVNETVTVRIVDGMVDNTYVEGSVAPTGTVPTYQEVLAEYDQMVAATATANAAAQTAVNTANAAAQTAINTADTAAANCAAIVAAPYSNSATYAVGSYCTKDGKLYECTTAITTAEEWTAGHWTETKVGPEVSDLRSALDTVKGSITNEELIDWSDAGTTNYPNGWAKGYYNADTGANASSNLYIRTNSTYYFSDDGATLMELYAPAGYAVRAFEYKPDGTYVGKHGSMSDTSIGSHVFFEFEKGNKFRFSMGKFTDASDAESHYADTDFLASCRAVFYTVKAESEIESIEKQIEGISLNLDAVFYTEELQLTADDLRTGYYDVNTGSLVASNRYISSGRNVVISKSNATRLTAKAPEGYFICAYEYTSGGVYVGKHGSIKTTKEIEASFTEGHYFRFSIGRFTEENPASDNLTDAFAAQIKISIDEIKLPQIDTKKDRTGDFEFFTVTVDRPLAFGGEETIDAEEEQEIECVLRLPSTYTKQGTPTRLVLACHGASGYIQASSSKWYNGNWKTFMDELLAAGYAVFDSNVLPASTGTDQMGYAVGSPYYVNVLKKAYDYIVYNYNVCPEIFAHGTSMGGVGATAFAHAYPEIVLAESSFAGRSVLRYLYYISINDLDKSEEFAAAWGYNSYADLIADKFSHVDGCFPDLSIINYVSGAMQTPPDRETDFSGWLEYFGQIANLAAGSDPGVWTGCRKVPYKAWNSWADSAQYTKLIEVLSKIYKCGNSCPFYSVTYQTGTHTEMSYGQINDMIPQLIAWYKRWE